MFRHKNGQEDLISLVGCHVPGKEIHQFVLDALSRLCDNHMPAKESEKVRSLYPTDKLPGQCDVKVGQSSG